MKMWPFSGSDKKEAPQMGGQAGKAQTALKSRGSQIDAAVEAASGGPSGKDAAAAAGTQRLTPDDKRIK